MQTEKYIDNHINLKKNGQTDARSLQYKQQQFFDMRRRISNKELQK